MSVRKLSLCLASMVLFTGCGGDEFETAPVTGKVTVDGKPLGAGKIIFSPQSTDNQAAGRVASTEVSADGSYKIYGVVVGDHKVSVVLPLTEEEEEEEDEREMAADFAPKTDQTYTVAAGETNQIDVALTRPTRKGRRRGR